MKKLALLVYIALLAVCAYAQQPAWNELDNFHELVKTALHPVETGDLKPVKKNSGLLLQKAGQWKSSAVPAQFNYEAVQTDLDKLVTICQQLDEAVKKNKSSAEIKKMALALHDHFHRILAAIKKNHPASN
ncbi:MAG: hypothetical protein ABJB86_19260 [Bacteroidota bacterium]